MSRVSKLFWVGGILVLAGAGETRIQARHASSQECYAVCKYKGNSGATYMGVSSSNCDSACTEAENKCLKEKDAPCEKIRCTATNCN